MRIVAIVGPVEVRTYLHYRPLAPLPKRARSRGAHGAEATPDVTRHLILTQFGDQDELAPAARRRLGSAVLALGAVFSVAVAVAVVIGVAVFAAK